MPAYFYHLSFELLSLPVSNSPNSANSQSLAVDAARDALRPFQKRLTRISGSSCSSSQSKFVSASESNLPLRNRSSTSKINPTTTSSTLHHYNISNFASSDATSTSDAESQDDVTRIQNDNRFDTFSIECIDMLASDDRPAKYTQKRENAPPDTEANSLVSAGIGTDILGGPRTKGRYVPLDKKVTDSVWGIVHLYRDVQESPYLAGNEIDYPDHVTGSAAATRRLGEQQASSQQHAAGAASTESTGRTAAGASAYPFPVIASSSAQSSEEDCTTLCILAVPSYYGPTDFLGFVGEKTTEIVNHFRMIRTARPNRYMVLMKFRSARKAKEWQQQWNGKVFSDMEPETCHVVFVKSVEIQVIEPQSPSAITAAEAGAVSPSRPPVSSAALSTKPFAPPTPALIELPTCPVCLERMDETSGLLTIICQHVFHCTCLQKWKGSGCPVCRYTQDDFRKSSAGLQPGPHEAECSVCHLEESLWVCLICGNVGCGRYEGRHAFDHWKETTHAFAMDIETQRVWDYVGDAYVHRIIQNKTDGKLVELPAAGNSALDPPDWEDAVPREKFDSLSLEYTHLLCSQMESQRVYFEEVVERAVDKASQATAAAAMAEEAAKDASARLADLQAKYADLQCKHDHLANEVIPTLERNHTRAATRADKFESLSRNLEKNYSEEKAMNENLVERTNLLTGEVEALRNLNADLKEQNRDLTFFISGSERLQGQGEDVVEGTVSVPEPEPESAKKKKKGKGKR